MALHNQSKEVTLLEALQDAFTKIKTACDHAEGLTSDKLIKANERIKLRINSFMSIYMTSVESNMIVADPFGISTKQNLPNKYARKCVDEFIKEHQSKASDSDQAISSFDLIAIKAAILGGAKAVKGKLANGVNWFYDKATDTMVFSYFFALSYVCMIADKIKEGWNKFCELIKSAFNKEESIEQKAA